MDDNFEFSCSKEHQQKFRNIKLPKGHSRHGYIKTYFAEPNIGIRPENSGREYSLSKKGRWKLLDEFKNDIESFNDDVDNVRVSAIERVQKLAATVGPYNYNDVKSCHTVDSDGHPVHRYATHCYANTNSLMNKEIFPGKKTIKSRWRDQQQNKTPKEIVGEPKLHIIHEIVKPCNSVGLWDKDQKALSRSNNRWKRPIVRASLKDIMEDQILEEEHWNQSEMDEHEEEIEADIATDKPSWYSASVDIHDFLQPKRERKCSEKEQLRISCDIDINCATNNFEMVPIKIDCPVEELDEESLKNRFGKNYYECSSLPRRFCIDISRTVTKVLPLSHRNSSNFLINALCIFEVIPPKLKDFRIFNEFSSESDEDDDCETNEVLFWINGLFEQQVKNLVLHSIDLSSYQSVDAIVSEAVTLVATLPSQYFVKNSSMMTLNHGFKAFHAKELLHRLPERIIQCQFSADSSCSWFSDVGENSCGACNEWLFDGDGFCLSECRHWYCKSCWYNYCNEKVNSGSVLLTCPEDSCAAIVDYDMLVTILPVSQCLIYSSLLQ